MTEELVPKKRGRPKKSGPNVPELSDGQTQRGPNVATRNVYKKGQPQRFMDELIASGKYRTVVDEVTGQGVFVGLFNPRSAKTESGRDVALVLFEVFRGDASDCCKAATKMDKATGQHTCKDCGLPCTAHQEWIRKPTYIPNPRTGGRVAIWNQAILQWNLISGVRDAIGILSGLGLVEKQTEMRATQEVVEDKALTNLRRYAI